MPSAGYQLIIRHNCSISTRLASLLGRSQGRLIDSLIISNVKIPRASPLIRGTFRRLPPYKGGLGGSKIAKLARRSQHSYAKTQQSWKQQLWFGKPASNYSEIAILYYLLTNTEPISVIRSSAWYSFDTTQTT